MMLATMLVAIGAQAATFTLPEIDHTKALSVRPARDNVVMCASPEALPLARLAARSAERGGPDYGLTSLMKNGGCITTLDDRRAMPGDFQELVTWAGALQPPHMLHGTLLEIRVRVPLGESVPDMKGVDAYYYIAAEDVRP